MKTILGIVLSLCLGSAGCAERTMVRSYPPGAKLSVNGSLVGTTPMIYEVDRAVYKKTPEFHVQLERRGYLTTEGTLRKQTCDGRIVAGIFTLGILFLFKEPICFSSPQDFALEPMTTDTVSSEGVANHLTVEERLDRLQKLHEQGTITDEEYEQYRVQILRDL